MAQRYAMTISVPQGMRAEMAEFEEENWSAVAQEAFQKRLNELTAKKKGQSSMDSAIDRLRKSKEKSDSEEHKGGFEAGSKWAKEEAEWTDLKALDQRFRDSDTLDLKRPWSDHNDYEAAASVVEALDREQPGRERVEECWACLMNTPPAFFELSSITDVFVSSWIEGALEVYDAVKDKV